MKGKKAAEEDRLVNEIWKYGGERVRRKIWEICIIWKYNLERRGMT